MHALRRGDAPRQPPFSAGPSPAHHASLPSAGIPPEIYAGSATLSSQAVRGEEALWALCAQLHGHLESLGATSGGRNPWQSVVKRVWTRSKRRLADVQLIVRLRKRTASMRCANRLSLIHRNSRGKTVLQDQITPTFGAIISMQQMLVVVRPKLNNRSPHAAYPGGVVRENNLTNALIPLTLSDLLAACFR